MDPMAAIRIEDLTKRYKGQTAVDHVTFDVPRGSGCRTRVLPRIAGGDECCPIHFASGGMPVEDPPPQPSPARGEGELVLNPLPLDGGGLGRG